VELGTTDKQTLTRYLLGELSPQEREQLEREQLAQPEFREDLIAVENDLIDSYVRGDLPDEQRRQFENHFLDSLEKQERVELAKLLMDSNLRQMIEVRPIHEQPEAGSWLAWIGESRPRRFAMLKMALGAIAACGLAVLAGFLLLETQRLHRELAQLQSQQTASQEHIRQLEQQIVNSRAGENNPVDHSGPSARRELTVSALLIPGLSRGAGEHNTSGRLEIPAAASWVRLMLELERDDYPRYEAVIETPEGKRVSLVEGLASEPGEKGGRIVSMRLPSRALKNGDYVITLSGQKSRGNVEAVDSYSFTVRR